MYRALSKIATHCAASDRVLAYAEGNLDLQFCSLIHIPLCINVLTLQWQTCAVAKRQATDQTPPFKAASNLGLHHF